MMDAMASSDLGVRIRRARERKRWSQEQLAAAIGVGTRSVGRWERGESVPRNSIGAIEDVLGVGLSGEPPGLEPWEQELVDMKHLPPGLDVGELIELAHQAMGRHRNAS